MSQKLDVRAVDWTRACARTSLNICECPRFKAFKVNLSAENEYKVMHETKTMFHLAKVLYGWCFIVESVYFC
ncbi:MAG: hypothetical protein ABJO54_04870, partial [Hyphomicrobiales bacterium]